MEAQQAQAAALQQALENAQAQHAQVHLPAGSVMWHVYPVASSQYSTNALIQTSLSVDTCPDPTPLAHLSAFYV